jgi:hypothetical protein
MRAIMARSDVFTAKDPDAWVEALEQCAAHDFYHLPHYHALSEETGEGAARLFRYTEGAYTIALPLLLRPMEEDALAPLGRAGWRDATSVYGYAGPVCSHDAVPDVVVRNFRSALRGWLGDLRVVSIFSRLHPLFPQRPLLAGLGRCQALGLTVSVDLTLPAEVQFSRFRRDHRQGVRRLRRRGVNCLHDRDRSYLADFVRIYHETMHRVAAAEWYLFSAGYFERLLEALGPRIHLFVCLLEGRAVCGGLFVACQGILQFHLSGTLNEALVFAPSKLLLDEVRLWATGQGLRALHLGGGIKSDLDDSLLKFKMGFSDRTHEFFVWRWVLFPDVYRQLCVAKSRFDERQGRRTAVANYFPEYRCPTVAVGAPEDPTRVPRGEK